MLPKKAEEMEAPCKAALCPSPGKFIPLCTSLGDLWGHRAQTTYHHYGVQKWGLLTSAASGQWRQAQDGCGGGIVLSRRETVEAQPHSWWPWGRKEAGRGQGPGDATAGSFVNSGLAKAALPPPQQCPLCPEAQARDLLSGVLTPTLAVLARELPATPGRSPLGCRDKRTGFP